MQFDRLFASRVNTRHRERSARARGGNVQVISPIKNLAGITRGKLKRLSDARSREAKIRLARAKRVAGDSERRVAVAVGPNVRMTTGVVVQLDIGTEVCLASNRAIIPGVEIQSGQ